MCERLLEPVRLTYAFCPLTSDRRAEMTSCASAKIDQCDDQDDSFEFPSGAVGGCDLSACNIEARDQLLVGADPSAHDLFV